MTGFSGTGLEMWATKCEGLDAPSTGESPRIMGILPHILIGNYLEMFKPIGKYREA